MHHLADEITIRTAVHDYLSLKSSFRTPRLIVIQEHEGLKT
uniref:Uncharacterized protein n=1 Tax=Lepeophtheirus salmonis TaxID=72036 RepID=A0A0K2V8H2_LEPSM